MIGLLQRATHASVVVDGVTVGAIGAGLLVLVCAEPGDDEPNARKLIDKLLALRVFADDAGKMNRSLRDIAGGLLLVPQFTLGADLRGGNRPSFSGAAEPVLGRRLFDHAVAYARSVHPTVATGQFGAHMAVSLTNDGPVTLWVRIGPAATRPMGAD